VRRLGAAAAAAGIALAWAAPALACPVCYGEASGGVIDGTKLSVAFLGGLLYLLLFGGVGMAVVVRRRAVRMSDPRHGLRLIDAGGADENGEAAGGFEASDHGGRPMPPEETSER
jgi:hypothetical protein